jgi:hypothetical protein
MTVTRVTALNIGFTGRPDNWVGVLRDGDGNIVAECGHSHPNRDEASTYKSAATACMKSQVVEVLLRNVVAKEAEAQRMYERQKEVLLIKIPDRVVHPMVSQCLELAPKLENTIVFLRGRLAATRSREQYNAWLAETPAEERKKFLH